MSNDEKISKSEKREKAREQARKANESRLKREKRNKVLWQFGVIGSIIVAAVVIVMVVTQAIKPPGPGPKNMISDGVIFAKELEVVPTPALKPGADNKPTKVDRENNPVDIVIYQDYLCPYCGIFERTNAKFIELMTASGEVTYEIHPIAALDRASAGTKYSTRSTNAFACVVNYQPEKAFAFNAKLFEQDVQPPERQRGLSNETLLKHMKSSGVKITEKIKSCVNNVQFSSWTKDALKRIQTEPLPNTDTRFSGTPTVVVDGEQYQGSISDASAFESFVNQKVASRGGNETEGGEENNQATPAPTPSS